MEENIDTKVWDCVVVGAGIAGLTAATFLARSGKEVLLLEKGRMLGGRAMTTVKDRVYINLGPHAFYKKGKSIKILSELGITLQGGTAAKSGMVVYKNQTMVLPTDLLKLLTSRLFNWKGKLVLLRFFINLKRLVMCVNGDITLSQWLDQHVKDEHAKRFLLMLVRLSSYHNDPDFISARASFKQLLLGKAIYVHYGWQSIINALKEQALIAGVTIKTKSSVQKIEGNHPRFVVSLKGDQTMLTKTILSTANPKETAYMFHEHEESQQLDFLHQLIPIRAACMDVVLTQLPKPNNSFVLGMDEPLYFSNHSVVAKLSRNDETSVVHVLKYLSSSDKQDNEQLKHELEMFMSRIQPGWEDFVAMKRFLPSMTVSHFSKNVKEIPKTFVPHIPGLFLAGDWVGTEGLLADRSLISAKTAASAIISFSENEH